MALQPLKRLFHIIPVRCYTIQQGKVRLGCPNGLPTNEALTCACLISNSCAYFSARSHRINVSSSIPVAPSNPGSPPTLSCRSMFPSALTRCCSWLSSCACLPAAVEPGLLFALPFISPNLYAISTLRACGVSSWSAIEVRSTRNWSVYLAKAVAYLMSELMSNLHACCRSAMMSPRTQSQSQPQLLHQLPLGGPLSQQQQTVSALGCVKHNSQGRRQAWTCLLTHIGMHATKQGRRSGREHQSSQVESNQAHVDCSRAKST